LIVEVPDMETFQRVMESEATAGAMKFDGVRRKHSLRSSSRKHQSPQVDLLFR